MSNAPGRETLTGEVVGISFRNAETGYSIMRVKMEGERDPATIVGQCLASIGETLRAEGQWDNHPKFGRQFTAASIRAVLPTSQKGIERYLSSGIIRGVGPVTAQRIVAALGEGTVPVLDEGDADRLSTVKGVTRKKAGSIIEAWKENRDVRETVIALAGYGVELALSHRIVLQYGKAAADVVRNDPYRLAREVRGVGFLTADTIAKSLGIPSNAPERIEAGISHVIRMVGTEGHCGVEEATFVANAVSLLGIDAPIITPCINRMAREETVLTRVAMSVGESASKVSHLFDARLYRAEKRIAQGIIERMASAPTLVIRGGSPADVARKAEVECGVELAPEQSEAVIMALTNKVGILTGGPGTGKTSTLRVILQALQSCGASVSMGAPTGKAAKRMRETTGHDAATIARLTGQGTSNQGETTIGCDVLIVDEASMLDVYMLDALLKCLPDRSSLLLVGDVDQLPSVGPGRVLFDLIDSDVVPTVRLTKIFRQAAQSAIIRNAHRINAGDALEPKSDSESDFHFMAAKDPDSIAASIVSLVASAIPERIGIRPEAIQVLSPMRRTATGAENLNKLLQKALNPRPSRFVERGGNRYGVGDRIIQIVNNYDLGVMNGESGIVVDVDEDAKTLTAQIDDAHITYKFTDLDQINLAYAMSIHKSQGSQFDAVVIPVTTQHYRMLHRALFYTGVTRAARFCVLIGQPHAMNMAIRNIDNTKRITTLARRLRNASWG